LRIVASVPLTYSSTLWFSSLLPFSTYLSPCQISMQLRSSTIPDSKRFSKPLFDLKTSMLTRPTKTSIPRWRPAKLLSNLNDNTSSPYSLPLPPQYAPQPHTSVCGPPLLAYCCIGLPAKRKHVLRSFSTCPWIHASQGSRAPATQQRNFSHVFKLFIHYLSAIATV